MNTLKTLDDYTHTMSDEAKQLQAIAEALKNIDSRLLVIDKHICMMCDLSKGMIREA